MAFVPKSITIGDREYTIGQFDALTAIDVGCLAQQWRAQQFGRAAAGIGDPQQLAASLFGSLELIAKMYASPEYRSKVFFPTLELCTHRGQPVIDRDGVWKLTYGGAAVADLLKLFQAALEHGCGGFFLATQDDAGTNETAPEPEPTT